jgi:hypothetical protein
MTEMTKKPGKSQTESSGKSLSNIEFHPDAWERFERAAGVVAKAPPQHRRAKKKKKVVKKRAPLRRG